MDALPPVSTPLRSRVAGAASARGTRRLGGGRIRAGLGVLAGLCVLGALLRAATISSQSFDYDESFTASIVHGSLGHVFHQLPRTESTPPLYYVLVWVWTRVFGTGAVGLRSLSVLVGTALILVAFLAVRELSSQRAGLIAALLVAVNPFFVWYSQEARSYALLALLSALSFWAFVRTLDAPTRGRFAAWTVASGLAVLTHYFAGFLVAPEAVWLMVVTRRRAAMTASAAVAVVGAALVPLVVSQADARSQWIENLAFGSRVKEVIKKWLTGEIAPTRNLEQAVVAVLVFISLVYACVRLSERERVGVLTALGIGAVALLVPVVVDLAGFHYFISKNVMPAAVVLLLGGALILGARRGGWVALAGVFVSASFFLAISVDGIFDPALQRPDIRAAARGIGPPILQQVVVTPNLGNAPMAYYRPGASPVPAVWLANQVILVEPLPRADVTDHRPPTPPAPAGFNLLGRRDASTYTVICYGSPIARPTASATLLNLTPSANLQVWASAPASQAGEPAAAAPCQG